MRLVLASQSASRRAMLDAAGVPYDARTGARWTRMAVKAALARAAAARPRRCAGRAEGAQGVASAIPARWCWAAIRWWRWPTARCSTSRSDRADAAEHLRAMSGGTHDLCSAAVIAEGGRAGVAACRTREAARPGAVRRIHRAVSRPEWPAIAGASAVFGSRDRACSCSPDRREPFHHARHAAAAGAGLSAGTRGILAS